MACMLTSIFDSLLPLAVPVINRFVCVTRGKNEINTNARMFKFELRKNMLLIDGKLDRWLKMGETRHWHG